MRKVHLGIAFLIIFVLVVFCLLMARGWSERPTSHTQKIDRESLSYDIGYDEGFLDGSAAAVMVLLEHGGTNLDIDVLLEKKKLLRSWRQPGTNSSPLVRGPSSD